MSRRRRGMAPLRAGLLAMLLASLAALLAFTKGVPGVAHHYTVHAVFSSATNLLSGSSVRAGSPVRIAGVDVGQVTGVRRGPGTTAVVSMRIDEAGRPVHRDATAKIRPRLFLEGNFFVELRPGSPSAPELADGATIPLAQTAVPVQLDQVLDALPADTRASLKTVLREYARALRGGGAEALRRSYAESPGAFRAVALAAEAAQGRRADDLAGFVAGAARTARALAQRERDLGELVAGFQRVAGALADRREALARSLGGLRELAVAAPAQLRAIDGAVPPLQRFARALRPALAQAPPTLDAALPFLAELGRLVAPAALPALIADLRPTVRTLAALEPDLVALLDLVTPVAGCVRDRALPVLESRLDDGALSSGQTVWEELLHATSGLTAATQNFDGSGYSTRFSFGSGEDVVSLGAATAAERQQLFALGAIDGSRPPRPERLPPFRPAVPCETQAPPRLDVAARPPVGQRRVGTADGRTLRALGTLLAGSGEAPGGAGR